MSARIISAKRSPVAPRGGALSHLDIHELGAPVVLACLKDAGVALDQVDELIVSNALGAGGNPARITALAAGLPERVAGLSIDRQCTGGLDALLIAKAMVESGQANVVVAGGIESYSRRPLRFRITQGDPVQYDRPPFTPWPDRDPEMHVAAEALAQGMGISRAEQDAWAVQSHADARAADHSAEIVPFASCLSDSFTRNLTPALCARAKPIVGSITTANTAVAADAAAFCVVVSETVAAKLGKEGLTFKGATRGNTPDQPGLGPVPAIRDLIGQSKPQFDAVELMEAYAVQAIACARETGLSRNRINLGGGALARGHPIGASGAILAVRLFHELQRRKGPDSRTGLAAIAAAGGIGTALLMHRP